MKIVNQLINTAAVLAVVSSGAQAQTPPELPGRVTGEISKTVIFNVTDERSNSGVFRAVITCEKGRQKMRKMTDSTGTASLAFKIDARPYANSSIDCIVHKRGFAPAYKKLDFNKLEPPVMIRIDLKKD